MAYLVVLTREKSNLILSNDQLRFSRTRPSSLLVGTIERHTLCLHVGSIICHVVQKSRCITKVGCIKYWQLNIWSVWCDFKQIVE